MLCCRDCNIETESALTAVLYIDQLSQQRQNLLQRYAHKHLKNMRIHCNNESGKDQPFDSRKDKENNLATSNVPCTTSASDNIKTIRKCPPVISSQHLDPYSGICETGRFKETPKSSTSRKNMQSKTTSFGSLASRSSNADFLQKIEIKQLQEELQSLKEEEMRLLRQKLERDYQYKKELLKINGMRDSLKERSQERQNQLQQLKQLFAKKKSRLTVRQ